MPRNRMDRPGNRCAVGVLRVFMFRRLLTALLVLNVALASVAQAAVGVSGRLSTQTSTVGIANGTVSGDLDLGEILKNAAISAGTSYLTSSVNLKAMGQEQASALAEAQGNAALAVVDDLGTRTLLGSAWGEGLTTSVFGSNLTVANILEGGFDATLSAGVQT